MARLAVKPQIGSWYFQHTYQMRDRARTKLKAKTKDQAIKAGRKMLARHPDLDEPCIVFVSRDGSFSQIFNL